MLKISRLAVRVLCGAAVSLFLPVVASAQASTVAASGFGYIRPVSSYDMLNGETGYWHYHDISYPSPNANLDFGPLTGGTGLLTDGVFATQSWDDGSALNPPVVDPITHLGVTDHGVFVGWYINPSVTFFFDYTQAFTHLRVNYDIAYTGAVGPPGPVVINGVPFFTTIPAGTDPFWADYDISMLAPSSFVQIDFTRTVDPEIAWLMISEVEFEDTAPEPATLVLFATGLLGVAGAVRLRRR